MKTFIKKIACEAGWHWREFWHALRDSSYFRNRFIGFGIVAYVNAFDLAFFLFGRNRNSVIAAIVFGSLCWRFLERRSRAHSSAILFMPDFGLPQRFQYFFWPTCMLALSCIIKFIWSRGEHLTWFGIYILSETFLAIRTVVRVYRHALDQLEKHWTHVLVAKSYLLFRNRQCGDPEERMTTILEEWTGDIYDDLDWSKNPIRADVDVTEGASTEDQTSN